MNQNLVVGNGTVLTLGPNHRVITDGAVLIEGDTITEIGTTAQLRPRATEFIDAGGRLIMPGLICAHHHLYSTFACGLGAAPAQNFVQVLENLWWKLDRALDLDGVFDSAIIPLVRCIRSGTTTIIDHHASPNAIRGSLNRIADAVQLAGLRASLCYEVTCRNGEAGAREGIEENATWLEQCRSNPMLHGLVGVHAAMTVDDPTLQACVDVAQRAGTGLHIHVAEDRADQDDSLNKYGQRVVQRLHEKGGLGPSTMAIHCVHVDATERALLRDTETIVVHNPQSNMNNAVGQAAVGPMLQDGVTVCLGTDGMTSNMLEEARAALFIRHHVDRDPSAGFGDVVRMLWENNAAVASRFFGRSLGVLAPGAAADVIVADHLPFTPLTGENTFGHILFGAAAERIDTTICAGRVLMRAGRLTNIDLAEWIAPIAKRTPQTWDRFSAQ